MDAKELRDALLRIAPDDVSPVIWCELRNEFLAACKTHEATLRLFNAHVVASQCQQRKLTAQVEALQRRMIKVESSLGRDDPRRNDSDCPRIKEG